ncbi:MAG: hypothetical protein ABL876_08855 [Chitinophagaceae bacterium]
MKPPPIAGRLQNISVLLITVLFISCQKESSPQSESSNNKTTSKIITWLEKQKATASAEGVAKIQSLKKNLDFSLLTTGLFNSEEPIIIVPIKKSFVATSNADRNPINSLVFFLDNKEDIRRGNILQYISTQRVSSRRVLANFFDRYYNFRITDFTGSLVYVTVTDEIAYELNYIKGSVNYYKSVEIKQLNGLTEACYELGWYYYWSDGTVTWKPIGRYYGDCLPVRKINGQTYRVNCGGGENNGEPAEE